MRKDKYQVTLDYKDFHIQEVRTISEDKITKVVTDDKRQFYFSDNKGNKLFEIHGKYYTENIDIRRSPESKKEILYKGRDKNGQIIEISCYHDKPLKSITGSNKSKISPKQARKAKLNLGQTGKVLMVAISGGVHNIQAFLDLSQSRKVLNALKKGERRLK